MVQTVVPGGNVAGLAKFPAQGVVSSAVRGRGVITVSAKGISNGLSDIINDGADFGVDTPGTQTSGIQEAWNYAVNNPVDFDNPDGYSPPLHYWIRQVIITPGRYYIYQPIAISPPIINKDGNDYYIANIYIGGMPYSDMQPYLYGMFNDEYIFSVDASQTYSGDVYFGYMQLAVPTDSSGTPIYAPAGALSMGKGEYTSLFYDTLQLNNLNISNSGWSSYSVQIGYTNRIAIYESKLTGIKIQVTGTFQMFGGWLYQNGSIHSIIQATHVVLEPNFTYDIVEIGSSAYPASTVVIFGSNISNATPFLVNNNIPTFSIENCQYSMDITTLIGIGSAVSSATIGLMIRNLNSSLVPSTPYTISQYIGSGISISLPTISANPPVSGTVYQNTNPYGIEIDLPVYATTSATAGYVAVAKGATSTPTAIGNQYVSGDTSDTSEQIIRLRVPAGWYYSFTASGVTFTTASIFAE